MFQPTIRVAALLILTLAISSAGLVANEPDQLIEPPTGVSFRQADVLSEGTRMTAEVFAPDEPAADQLPTIIMCHGWGGTAEHLRPDAVVFARAGYLVVTFDYRGWGKSDSRLILAGDAPKLQEGKLFAEVVEVREVVDPIDQTTDLLNVIHWIQAEDLCDGDRIGLWGSSYSGGHVLYAAARDPRVKALVSQVGSFDSRWAIQSLPMRHLTYQHGTARSRGKLKYPRPGTKFGTLTGFPILEKVMGYVPLEDADRSEGCAKLFIIAENEELFDNRDHGILAFERATGVKKLVTVPGIKHYGIYNEKRETAQQLALDWFNEHLN